MDVWPLKIQETVPKYSLSLDTLQPCILSDPEFNAFLGSCHNGKRLYLGMDKVKSLPSMALLYMMGICKLQVLSCPYLFSAKKAN